MIWTNNYNLPPAIVNAIKYDPYQKKGKMSITEIIQPPRIRILKARYADKLKQDVSDGLWRLLGQAIHVVLERGRVENTLKEERLSETVSGVLISGQVDLYHGDTQTVEDYKITSVYSFLLGDKPEWKRQLNCYAWLYRMAGFEVEKLKIHAILRDWTKSKVKGDYPPCPFQTVNIPLWNFVEQERYVKERVRLHVEAEERKDEGIPICTASERWHRPDTWAVMKKGRKTALRVCRSEEEAEMWIEDNGRGDYIEFRPGQDVRCENYCLVRDFCSQYRETQND